MQGAPRWKYKKRFLGPKQKRVYTMLGLSLFALSVFGAFAIRPTLATVAELNRKIKDQRAARDKLDKKIKDLSKAQVQLTKMKADIVLAEKALPKEKDLPTLLETLQLIAERNNLRLRHLGSGPSNNVSVTLPNQTLAVKSLPLSLQLEGSFPNFLGFLTEAENTLRQLNTENILINTRDRGIEYFSLQTLVYFTND